MNNFIIFILIIFFIWIFSFIFKKKILEIFVWRKFFLSTLFLFLSFFIAILAFVQYDFYKKWNFTTNSSDVVFILDVSQSMLALDYQEEQWTFSRLDVAKEFIKDFVLKYSQNRYSLVIFSGYYQDVLPFTNDADMFFTFLDNVNPDSISTWWNVLREAYTSALDRFKSEKTAWAIFVLSDFEFPWKDKSFIDSYLDNLVQYKNTDIKTISVWVWSYKWNTIPVWDNIFWNIINKTDDFWRSVVTRFDNYSFDYFSKIVWADKYMISRAYDIKNIVSKLWALPSRNIDVNKEMKFDISRYILMISYAFLLLYIVFYYLDRKKIWK